MSLQTWEETLTTPGNGYWAATPIDGAPYATSNALTDVSPAPQLSIPAGYMQPGRILRVTAHAKFSTTGTPTLLAGVYWGGVAGVKLAATGATTTASTASNYPLHMEAYVQCRTNGTAGTFRTAGQVMLGTSLTAWTAIPIDASASADVSVDTTIAKIITLGAQWGTSSGSNTLTCIHWFVEALN